MLLYVDKKKQKRRRVKIITAVLAGCFVLFANIVLFYSMLDKADMALVDSPSLQGKSTAVSEADANTIGLFSSKNNASPEIVIISKEINRFNLITTAYVFSKLSPTVKNVYFSPEVKSREYLLRLLRVYLPDVRLSDAKDGVIITTDYELFADVIQQNKLSPKIFYYSHAQRQQKPAVLDKLLNEKFPLPVMPKTRLEKEKSALAKFAGRYQKELRGLLNGNDVDFAFRHYLLQQANVCFVSEKNIICNFAANNSLQKNIRMLSENPSFSTAGIKKMALLTSLQEIDAGDDIQSDEGVAFRYGERETIILPGEKSKYDDLYSALLLNAGINPDYFADDMRYYKFKTVEVNADDKI